MSQHNCLEYWLDEKIFEIKLWYSENKVSIRRHMKVFIILLIGFLIGLLLFCLRRK